MHIKILGTYKLKNRNRVLCQRGVGWEKSINSAFICNVFVHFLHIFKWAYFIAAFLKWEKGDFTMQNKKGH